MTPRISILTACFNQAHYLGESVRSALAQTERELEVIIVNDGSTDHTEDVALRLCEEDQRVRLVNFATNRGLAAAQNAAVRASSAPWLLKLDADDRARPEYVERILAAAAQHPAANCIYSPAIQFWENGRVEVWRYPRYDPKTIATQHQIPGPAALTRSLWDAVGGLDEAQRTGGEDWDFYVRAAVLGVLVPVQLATPSWEYRQHAGPRMSEVGKQHIAELHRHYKTHTRASALAQASQWQ